MPSEPGGGRVRVSLLLVAASVVLATAGVALEGCGPSIRRTYQSDNAFVRCFDMDYNPGRSIDEKRECWQTWVGEHVYNQPEDKVAYAELRLEEIADGISVPGPPGPDGAFHERPVPPAPDAGVEPAPEPKPEPAEPKPDPVEEGDAGPAELPASDCEASCKKSYVPCSEACAEAAGDECAAACEAGYKSCMRDCFAE